jgi:hypothetical protein
MFSLTTTGCFVSRFGVDGADGIGKRALEEKRRYWKMPCTG